MARRRFDTVGCGRLSRQTNSLTYRGAAASTVRISIHSIFIVKIDLLGWQLLTSSFDSSRWALLIFFLLFFYVFWEGCCKMACTFLVLIINRSINS
jgi:hypothetical protein